MNDTELTVDKLIKIVRQLKDNCPVVDYAIVDASFMPENCEMLKIDVNYLCDGNEKYVYLMTEEKLSDLRNEFPMFRFLEFDVQKHAMGRMLKIPMRYTALD